MRVLVADDHGLFRAGLAGLLRAAINPAAEVDGFGDLGGAVDALTGRAYDLVLLDLRMPGMGGAEDAGRVVRAASGAPVVVVSASDAPEDEDAALAAGAAAFIAKSAEPAALLAVLRGVLDRAGGRAAGSRVPALTARQRDVLELMRLGRSNREIGAALGISEGTAKIHVSAVLRALGARNRTEAASVFRLDSSLS